MNELEEEGFKPIKPLDIPYVQMVLLVAHGFAYFVIAYNPEDMQCFPDTKEVYHEKRYPAHGMFTQLVNIDRAIMATEAERKAKGDQTPIEYRLCAHSSLN